MPTYPVTMTLLPVNQIRPNPDQPRKNFDPEDLKDLKESIQERGLINPISVLQLPNTSADRGEGGGSDGYMIIAGERRYRAVCELGWTMIDARIWPSTTRTQEVELLSLVENLQRADLAPIEVADGFHVLTQPPHNMTQEQLGQRLGKTKANINQYIALTEFDSEVKEKLNRFNLGLRHLLQICRLKAPEEQIALAQEVSEKELSVKELKARVDKAVSSEKPKANSSSTLADSSSLPFRFSRHGTQVKFTAAYDSTSSLDDFLAALRSAYMAWTTKDTGAKKAIVEMPQR
jgi:ParB family chromosome partitioning protein